MRARPKTVLATVLVTFAVLSNLLLVQSLLASAGAQVSGRLPESFDWQTFLVPEFGTTVDYPAGIFSLPDGKADIGVGQRFNSADGRSVLTIYSRENEDGDTPASYLEKNLRMTRSALNSERVTQSFFAISSTAQGLILYSRCNFSSDAGGAIHCFDLVYPSAEGRAWTPSSAASAARFVRSRASVGGFKIEERHSKCLDSIGDPCCRKLNPGHRGLLRAHHIFEARIQRGRLPR